MKRRIVALALVAFASGCSVVDSFSVTQDDVRPRQASGTYYLTKHLVQVTIERSYDVLDEKKPTLLNVTTKTVAVPDGGYRMQMGFAHSPFANDDIAVTYTSTGLLDNITSTATDKTSDIIIALAADAALLRSAATAQAIGSTIKKTHVLEFDPYDDGQAEAVNEQFRSIVGKRSCVEVEVHPGRWSPGCLGDRMALQSANFNTDPQVETPNFDRRDVPRKPGVYFRRPVPRTVHVVLHGKTEETRQMMFSNESPVYRIDIKRSAFVERKTIVDFTDGELVSVSVKKDSEVLAVAKLPVAIVDAYFGQVVNMLTQRKNVQDARANYYTSLAKAIDAGVTLDKSRVSRDEYFDKKDCLAAHPVDTTKCD